MKPKGRKPGELVSTGELRSSIGRSTLTHSSRAVFATCRRKFYWSYERRLSPRGTSIPLLIGDVVHQELESFYKAIKVKQRWGESGIDESKYRIRELFNKARAESRVDHVGGEAVAAAEAIACGAIAGYVRRWEDEDFRDLQVLATETEFNVQLGDGRIKGWDVLGKIDVLARLTIGGKRVVAVIDHKTVKSIDAGYVARVAIDSQLRRYIWACEKYFGKRVTHGIYNCIGKPQIRQKKKESFDAFVRRIEDEYENTAKYFHREVVEPDRRFIDAIPIDDVEIAYSIEQARLTNSWYQNDKACFDFNSACPYLGLCSDPDADKQPLHVLYEVRETAHPELKGKK